AYKAYMQMPYDRDTWDPTAVLYAVEGDKWFAVSEPGTIKVTEEGSTLFTPDEKGTRRYISVDKAQAEAIKAHFIELITSKPANKK
ncbi:MAG: nucleoside hydrolase, partial [Bacteroidales bacterium]|nr:nucleoside hydrolase [Bacteroidales bacterium]